MPPKRFEALRGKTYIWVFVFAEFLIIHRTMAFLS